MKQRYIATSIQKLALARKKMAFVSGPRQIGKTTLSKLMMDEFDHASYQNWDETTLEDFGQSLLIR